MCNKTEKYMADYAGVHYLVLVSLFMLFALITDCHSQSGYLEYRHNQLQVAKDLYEDNIKFNFNLLKGYLSPDHLGRLSNTELIISLDDDILSAKAYGNQNKIIISAATIIFLEELAVTHAYFDSLGVEDHQPIINYVLLLRKNMRLNELIRDSIPTMPDALGVPDEDIWAKDSLDRTKKYAQNFLNSAVVWILAHEMGHIALNHFAGPPEDMNNLQKAQYNRRLETEADEFATELMARVRLAPVGMALSIHYYSLLYPIRMEFRYEEDWLEYLAGESHPIWPDRLENMGRLFRQHKDDFNLDPGTIEMLARNLENLAQGLRSRDMLDGMILGSENLTFQNLMIFRPLENIDSKYYRPSNE